MNIIQKALAAELQRQHDHSGISGLVVSQTEEPSVLQVQGPVDLEALTTAVAKALGIDKPVFAEDGIGRNLQDGGPMHARFLSGGGQ